MPESNSVRSAALRVRDTADVEICTGSPGGCILFELLSIALMSACLMGCGQAQDARAIPPELSLEKPKSARADAPAPPPLSNSTVKEAPERELPVYELKMAPRDLAQLERSGYSNDTHPATFVAKGVTYDGVKVRFRGQWARTWPKKPLKIFFTHEKPFEGKHCLNLNSGWRDPAFVRETLGYHVYAACGVPAPRSRMVRLQVNGQFRGLYVEVEQPDKAFLSRINCKGASLFKAVSKSNRADERDLGAESAYSTHYDKETQKSDGYHDLQSFCHDLARTTNTLDFFTQRVDLERCINYLAATVLIQNWDCFNRNHFLLYDGRGSKKWWVVPWDLDRTSGDHWAGGFDEAQLPVFLGTRQLPGTTGWNRLEERFFSDATLRLRFVKRLTELLEQEFTTEKLFPFLDQLEAQITADAALDRQRWPAPVPDLHRGIAQLKSYIKRRRVFLLAALEKLRYAAR